jgi:hypothetical protein
MIAGWPRGDDLPVLFQLEERSVMKIKDRKRIHLSRETLMQLESRQLADALGLGPTAVTVCRTACVQSCMASCVCGGTARCTVTNCTTCC